MKNYLIIIVVALCSISTTMSQTKDDHSSVRQKHMNEIQSLKIAYMTEFLSLTPAESEKFWPIYNAYWAERRVLARKKRELYRAIESQTATMAQINAIVTLSNAEAALISNYASKLSKVTTVDKAVKTFVAEEKFKGTLLRRNQNSN